MKNIEYNRLLGGFSVFIGVVALSNLWAGGEPEKSVSVSEPLDVVARQDGSLLSLSVGIGSGAFHHPNDPQDIIYSVTDRGANIDAADAKDLLGLDMDGKTGKVFPTPNFAPTIYKLSVKDGSYQVLEKIQLKDRAGHPVSGLSNPDTEPAWDINGTPLAFDPEGIDAEGIVKLSDGTFWLGEEYAPSILHVAADGRILERWVPQGVAASLSGADYDIYEGLPGILRSRYLNRGIESIAVSPDEKFLYFSVQSPLANPDKDAYSKGRNARIFKVDVAKRCAVGEYVYQINAPDTFAKDNAKKPAKQSDVKLSEVTAVGQDALVVLERISKTTKWYRVQLTDAANMLGSAWDDAATSPSLEQVTPEQLAEKNIVLVEKKLLANSDDIDGFPSKIEGCAWLGGSNWMMINDNDFGIEGEQTSLIPMTMSIE